MVLTKQSSAESFTPHKPFKNVACTFFPKEQSLKLRYTKYGYEQRKY